MSLPKWPYYEKKQIEAVNNVLISGKVNKWTGDETTKFEEEFANYHNAEYGIALANGTVSLTAAYSAIGIKDGDEIITTPRTFIATSSAAVMLGAKPVFADVELDSGNISANTIEPLISKKTKAIAVVHLGGWPAEMKNICELAKKYNLKVVEDCSQAHGAKIKDISVGSFGDIATWSFCQDKIISTAGEGGMVTTNNEEYFNSIWSLKDHGKTLRSLKKQKNITGFKWVHDNFGTNYRLTELQSAIGRLQLKLLPNWILTRERNAKILFKSLKEIEALRIPLPDDYLTHAWYKFYAYLDLKKLRKGWDRDKIIATINDQGYPAFSGSCSEIYLEKCFINKGIKPNKELINAQELGKTSLMFLVHPTINKNQMEKYANSIKKVILKALK